MKTFEEACAAVMCRQVQNLPEDKADEAAKEMSENMARYHSTMDEVKRSPQAIMFAAALLELGDANGFRPENLFLIAFSHGVMVGMEMEKP